MFDRRDFLKAMAAATASLSAYTKGVFGAGEDRQRDELGEILPQRKLGKTGDSVTIVCPGGAHLVRGPDEREAEAMIEAAIEGGMRFFDTANQYGQGLAEERYGRYLSPKYREHVQILTKTHAPDAAAARQHLEESLRRMNTDYIDHWLIHHIQTEADIQNRVNNGVLDVFLEAKEQGKVRHIGFSSHHDYRGPLWLLEHTDQMEIGLMPINVLDPNFNSFIENLVPVLQEREIGVLGMKSVAEGRFFEQSEHRVIPDRLSVEEAHRFALSLPISSLMVGVESVALIQEKVEMARRFEAMGDPQRQELIERVADLADKGLEHYKPGHRVG